MDVEAENPYDEVPYPSMPIDWSAPERLALASLLHGGPRVGLDEYRVLELGCGDGGNLVPMSYYRRHASFVGVDGARGAIEVARRRAAELGLANLQLVQADFAEADAHLDGTFDFILAHGVLSWISDQARDSLLELCGRRLRPGGLLYLNYNARPGWNVREMVRDLLLAETVSAGSLHQRALRAQALAGELARGLATVNDHPYSRLLERELRFVCDGHIAYVAHEFLSPHNTPYWRRHFLGLAADHGLAYVADADFNYPSGRVGHELPERLSALGLGGLPLDDTVDLLSYRQLHSPIFTRQPDTLAPSAPQPHPRLAPTVDELAALLVAASLVPLNPGQSAPARFLHPSGFEVEAKDEPMRAAFERLAPLWPRAVSLPSLFPGPAPPFDDLMLLYRHGLIDLRLVEAGDFAAPAGPLNEREAQWGLLHATTPWHTREAPRARVDAAAATQRLAEPIATAAHFAAHLRL